VPSLKVSRRLYHHRLSVDKPLPHVVELDTTDVLTLQFQIVEKRTDDGVQPQQAFLRLYDSESLEEGIIPLRVTSLGKVKFQLVRFIPPNRRMRILKWLRTWLNHHHHSLQAEQIL
jgi:hypothetical protein